MKPSVAKGCLYAIPCTALFLLPLGLVYYFGSLYQLFRVMAWGWVVAVAWTYSWRVYVMGGHKHWTPALLTLCMTVGAVWWLQH